MNLKLWGILGDMLASIESAAVPTNIPSPLQEEKQDDVFEEHTDIQDLIIHDIISSHRYLYHVPRSS